MFLVCVRRPAEAHQYPIPSSELVPHKSKSAHRGTKRPVEPDFCPDLATLVSRFHLPAWKRFHGLRPRLNGRRFAWSPSTTPVQRSPIHRTSASTCDAIDRKSRLRCLLLGHLGQPECCREKYEQHHRYSVERPEAPRFLSGPPRPVGIGRRLSHPVHR